MPGCGGGGGAGVAPLIIWVARLVRRAAMSVLYAIIGLGAALLVLVALRSRPEDLPWTALDLTRPVGVFTGRKLAALGTDFPFCRALLDRAGVPYDVARVGGDAPGDDDRANCGARRAIRLVPRPGGIAMRPAGLVTSCQVAASLSLWQWNVVEPAAVRLLGSRVVAIDHFGAYNCRRIAPARGWSEHATANAVDVAGFRLIDGRRISVAADWNRHDAAGRFLHRVRRGACAIFATTLSPDYNAAHHDHLHLDEAARGAWGGNACR